MFRPTDKQGKLFDAYGLMTPDKRGACEKSWAGVFRERALPILLKAETKFAELYDNRMGRPNVSIALIIGTLLLKEIRNLTDMEALECLEFDTRWWYSFGIEPDEVIVCQKTLHNFRTGIIKHDKAKLMFRIISDELISALGVSTAKQRLDSTHILSNFAVLNRLKLFCETMRVFLHAVKKMKAHEYKYIPEGLLRRYSEESRYADARKEKGPRRLGVAARDIYRLAERFKGNGKVTRMEEYKLLARLLSEQCEITQKAKPPKDDDDDKMEEPVPVELKETKEVGADSLQTPHDPDVTYSGHKGKGYEVQLVETLRG